MLTPLLSNELVSVNPEAPVDYVWDEWNIQQYFYYADEDLFDRLAKLTYRANLSLMLAVCEWLEYRLRALSGDSTLELYIEAGWGAMGDPDRTEFFQLDDDDWRGPVRCPMAVGIGIICEAYFESPYEPEKAFQSCYAINILRHVLSPGSAFESWLERIIARLELTHTWSIERVSPEDVLADHFFQGRNVPREAFNLGQPYDPEQADELLATFRSRMSADNPFYHGVDQTSGMIPDDHGHSHS